MNHNLLTSKITKKEKLCQNIGPYAWQFCFFKMTLLSWFQVPSVFFACQKPSKALYLEMNFEMKLYDSFLRIKKWWEFFSSCSGYVDMKRFKHWRKNPGTNEFTGYFMNAVPGLVKESILFMFITRTTNRLLINNQKVKISRNSNFH